VVNAQSKPAEMSQPKTMGVNKGPPKLMKITGKIIEVDEKAKTIKVMSDGKEVTLNAAKLTKLPKVGEVHDISDVQSSGGPPEALTNNNLNGSRSSIN
jgi:hypothetical protein